MKDYKVVCISLYNEDLKILDENVEKLRNEGARNVSRSKLIRVALRRLWADKTSIHEVLKKLEEERWVFGEKL